MFTWLKKKSSDDKDKKSPVDKEKHSLAFWEMVNFLVASDSDSHLEPGPTRVAETELYVNASDLDTYLVCREGLDFDLVDRFWESEWNEAEEIIWYYFTVKKDFILAPYMPKLRHHNGIQALDNALGKLQRDYAYYKYHIGLQVCMGALLFNATFNGSFLEGIEHLFTSYKDIAWESDAPRYLAKSLAVSPPAYALVVRIYVNGPESGPEGGDYFDLLVFILRCHGMQVADEYDYSNQKKFCSYVRENFEKIPRDQRANAIARLENGEFDESLKNEFANKICCWRI